MKKLILVAAAATLLAGCDKPENYAECLIENMRGQDNIMAQVVGPYCREQFPAPTGAEQAAATPATEETKK